MCALTKMVWNSKMFMEVKKQIKDLVIRQAVEASTAKNQVFIVCNIIMRNHMYNLFLNMFAIWKQQVSIWISASKEIQSFFLVFSREIQCVMKCFTHNHTLI